jgi:uncharacterized membrane protein
MERVTPSSRRRRATYAALAFASLLSVALVAVRFAYAREPVHGGLIWNLFLAWIPFGLAIVVYDRHRAGARPLALLPLACLWLLFLPNAPYIVTDFKHLDPAGAAVPLWFDVLVIAAPAWTGMLLGFFSLYLVQAVVRGIAGETAGWALAVGALGLSSFGIYLGRVLRWNSWDLFANPRALGHDVWARLADPLSYPHTVAMTALLTAFLTAMYLTVYAFTRLDDA